jgi:hypothetical protein
MQQIDLGSVDTLFHLVIAVGAVAASWMAMIIKTALAKIQQTQARDKAELAYHQAEIKAELNVKHVENTQIMKAHAELDENKFEDIAQNQARQAEQLAKLDTKLDKVLDRISSK